MHQSYSWFLQFFKKNILIGLILSYGLCIHAQTNYRIIQAKNVSPTVVNIVLKVYSKNKKTVTQEAQYAAIRTILFDGCPDSQYNKKPLLENGEQTAMQQHPSYFNNLYNNRISDFILSSEALSKFKKADKKKATLYKIEVKALQLRKDLEKNNIRKRMGL